MDINTTGGDIEITGAITGTAGGNEALILDDGTGDGTITLGSTVGAGTNISDLTIISTSTAADSVKLGGNITTSSTAGDISITGPVTLTSDVTIDADAATTGVTFAATSKVNATSAGAQGLTINTGAGNISMGGAIGDSTSLKDLTINSATDGAGDITLANIGSTTVGVAGNTLIGNTNTGTINLNGTIYKTTGSQTYQASATGDDNGNNFDA